MDKPHARVIQHLEQFIEQAEGWQSVLTEICEAEANIQFEARAFIRGAQQRLRVSREGAEAAHTWIVAGEGPLGIAADRGPVVSDVGRI